MKKEFWEDPLHDAISDDDVDTADYLLQQGVDPNEPSPYGPQAFWAQSKAMIMLLHRYGANLSELSHGGKRTLMGLYHMPDRKVFKCDDDSVRNGGQPCYGQGNPEKVERPFWLAMVQSGIYAYQAGHKFRYLLKEKKYPLWCAERFGQSVTPLPDGCIVFAGGEHEDFYDPDFCIYNDVWLWHPGGHVDFYCYRRADFPPTDFHSATLIDDDIWLIGRLGYVGERQPGETPVYCLSLKDFSIREVKTQGEKPGWIFKHVALARSPTEIVVTRGELVSLKDGGEVFGENSDSFVLDITTKQWRKLPKTPQG